MENFKKRLEKVFKLQEELDHEKLNRIEGLTPQHAVDNLTQAAAEIAGNLLQEGFESLDIIEYLNGIVEAAVTSGMGPKEQKSQG